jgi:hypothetical protein
VSIESVALQDASEEKAKTKGSIAAALPGLLLMMTVRERTQKSRSSYVHGNGNPEHET